MQNSQLADHKAQQNESENATFEKQQRIGVISFYILCGIAAVIVYSRIGF